MSVESEKKPKLREEEMKKIKEEVNEVMNKRMGDCEKYSLEDVIRIDEINEEIGEFIFPTDPDFIADSHQDPYEYE